MNFELILLGATLLIVGWMLRRGSVGPRRWLPLALAIVAIALSHAWQIRSARRTATLSEAHSRVPASGKSPDYATSDSCRSCHPDQYASWHQSFHRTMTQEATPAAVRGNFDKVTLELAGEKTVLERRGDEFWADMADLDWKADRLVQQMRFDLGRAPRAPDPGAIAPRVQKKITLTTGSHHMQAYWISSAHGNLQLSFPFTYLFESSQWVPRADVFLRDPAAPPHAQSWNFNCLRCHATAGEPRQDPQTLIAQSRVAELGIACEACHGPGARHVELNSNPARRLQLRWDRRPDPSIVNPARLSPAKSAQVCGHCHGVNFFTEQKEWRTGPYTFHPGGEWEDYLTTLQYSKLAENKRLPEPMRQQPSQLHGSFWPDGMIRVSGREYNGLLDTPCFTNGPMSCLSCHSMHQSSPTNQLSSAMDGNQACLQCHRSLEKKIEAHTHHSASSPGSVCYNCHMPRTTYGLLKAIRSHQVSSPNVKTTIETGRPNACNLCHLDQTLAWTGTNLARWYRVPAPALSEEQQTTSAAVLWALRGDAGQRALLAWHFGWEPARQISGTGWMAPVLAPLLDDPYSAVRFIAARSLRRLPGFDGFSFNYISPPADRAAAPDRAWTQWHALPGRPENSAQIPKEKIAELNRQRDNRSMDLLE